MFPALSLAQFGAVSGVVRDASGAAVPGVTVEAASPALIEKSRTAVSDESGQYRVEQLRPGTYTVTFTLAGFGTVVREGIDISAGFTAPINVSLKVGAVQETISVSEKAPVVDVQSVSEQKTLVKQELDSLPTARSFATLGTTLPSVSANQRDVGGTQGEKGNVLSAHGGNIFDMTLQIDGISASTMGSTSGQAWSSFSLNDAAVQEMSFETSAISAESASGGVRVNAIPREGGNAFHGSGFTNYATRAMSRNNFTDSLKAQGLPSAPGFDKLLDESVGAGGPIKRDRIWFFYAQRYRSNDVTAANVYFSKDPLSPVYNPDTSRPIHVGGFDGDNQLRVTMQVTPRNKMSFFFDKANKCNCPVSSSNQTQTAESVANHLIYPSLWLGSISWQATISPKLLWDSAVSRNRQDNVTSPLVDGITATSPISVVEQTTGRIMRAPLTTNGEKALQTYMRAALSYVTGAHNVKVGITFHQGHRADPTFAYSDGIQYVVANGVPVSVNLTTAPYNLLQNVKADMGLYAQDKWTLHRLTLTGGIRWDYFNAEIPAQVEAASRWTPIRSFAAVPDVPNWKDISPRMGASYDLFGNGKTAIKVSVNRYVTPQAYAFGPNVNPVVASVNSATRGWTDTNGDFIPQGDPLNPLPNGEFTGTINPNFGKSILTTHYDPNLSQGWGKRPFNWEYSAYVQHELVPRVSVQGGYFRRTFGNQTVTDNLDVTPADFNPFCITAPTDPRLGSVSGSQICGLYDISPAKAGLASSQVITFAKNYSGETSQTYDGFDFNVNARPTGRFFLLAGLSIGRTITKNCALVDNPTTLRFCESDQPFQGQYRVTGGYTFPWKLQLSGVYQSIPPDQMTASYPITNSTPGNTLGRPIATPGGVINLPVANGLVAPYALFTDRVNQIDLRVTKTIQVERYRIELMADLYNVFNTSPVLTRNTAYGPAWFQPTSILQSGFLKVGARLTF